MRKPRKSKPEADPKEVASTLLREERRARAKELYSWLGYGAANEKLVGLACIDQETGEEEYLVMVKAEGDRMWPIALMFIDAPKALERYKPVEK